MKIFIYAFCLLALFCIYGIAIGEYHHFATLSICLMAIIGISLGLKKDNNKNLTMEIQIKRQLTLAEMLRQLKVGYVAVINVSEYDKATVKTSVERLRKQGYNLKYSSKGTRMESRVIRKADKS